MVELDNIEGRVEVAAVSILDRRMSRLERKMKRKYKERKGIFKLLMFFLPPFFPLFRMKRMARHCAFLRSKLGY